MIEIDISYRIPKMKEHPAQKYLDKYPSDFKSMTTYLINLYFVEAFAFISNEFADHSEELRLTRKIYSHSVQGMP